MIKAMWSGELRSDNYTLQLSMSVATMKEKIVDVSVRLNQAMRQQFPRHHHAYLCLSRGLTSYFKTGPSFVGLTWLFTGISEGKILFLASSTYVDAFLQSIVISFIHYQYTL